MASANQGPVVHDADYHILFDQPLAGRAGPRLLDLVERGIDPDPRGLESREDG